MQSHLIKKAKEDEAHDSHVFYLKMQGDYYRYLSEVSQGDQRKGKVLQYFQQVFLIVELPVCLILLDCVINFTVLVSLSVSVRSSSQCHRAEVKGNLF